MGGMGSSESPPGGMARWFGKGSSWADDDCLFCMATIWRSDDKAACMFGLASRSEVRSTALWRNSLAKRDWAVSDESPSKAEPASDSARVVAAAVSAAMLAAWLAEMLAETLTGKLAGMLGGTLVEGVRSCGRCSS